MDFLAKLTYIFVECYFLRTVYLELIWQIIYFHRRFLENLVLVPS